MANDPRTSGLPLRRGWRTMFATDALGEATYLGPEWTDMFGGGTAGLPKGGWVAHVHPDDREPVRSILVSACRAARPFSLRCRLRRANGRHVWVVAGAAPSFNVADHLLVGFVGSLTLLAASHSNDVRTYGSIGFIHPPPDDAGQTLDPLGRAADHLLIVHDLLMQAGRRNLAGPVQLALYMIGHALAEGGSDTRQTDLQ